MRLRFDRFTLDTDSRQLFRDAEPVHLSPKAFDLLRLLAENRPKALSKAELHAHLWPDAFVSEGSLAVLVAEIRTALDDEAREPKFIRTVQRHGYAFCGEAVAVRAAAPVAVEAPTFWLFWETGHAALAAGENIVGRDSDAAVRFDAPGISRRHARITVAGEEATLEDLGSKNGTYVHGDRIATPVELADGDDIRLGPIEVRFRIVSSATSTETVTAPKEDGPVPKA